MGEQVSAVLGRGQVGRLVSRGLPGCRRVHGGRKGWAGFLGLQTSGDVGNMKVFQLRGQPAPEATCPVQITAATFCPRPQETTVHPETIQLAYPLQIRHRGLPDDSPLVPLLTEELALWGFKDSVTEVPLPQGGNEEGPGKKEEDKKEGDKREGGGNEVPPARRREGYQLTTSETGLTVRASSDSGLYYGVQKVIQLVRAYGLAGVDPETTRFLLPGLTIADWPDMEIRGVSDDVSRGQAPTVANVKRFLKHLAHFGLNHWFFSFEDMYRFEKYPSIGAGRGAYARQEIAEIVAFGRRHHVTVAPIFQGLGHIDNILTDPEFVEHAEFPGSDCLNIADPGALALVDDWYGELAEVFGGKTFHMGLDESWNVGNYRSKDYVADVGLGPAYLTYYTRLHEILVGHGMSRLFMWHDIAVKYPEVLAGLPRDVILDYWRYNRRDEHPDLDKILAAGLQAVVSPSCCDWARPFPALVTSEQNIEKLIRYGAARGVLGQVNTSWGDFRNENLRENRFYGYVMSTVLSWNVAQFDVGQFRRNFARHFLGLPAGGGLEEVLKVLAIFRSLDETKLFLRSKRLHFVYQLFFSNLWAHPFPNVKQHLKTRGYTSVIRDMDWIVATCDALSKKVPKNALNLENFAFSAKLVRFVCQKRLLSKKLAPLRKRSAAPAEVPEVVAELEHLGHAIRALKDEYERLWRASCKPAHLEDLLLQYDWMAQFYADKVAEIQAGAPWANPFISAEWIYYCPEKARGVPTSYYKTFTLEQLPDRAWIQVIGGNSCDVHVNGTHAGHVFTQRTLSIKIYDQNVRVFEITDLLQPGRNNLVLVNRDYLGGWGLVNLYAELHHADGRVDVLVTDRSWRATRETPTSEEGEAIAPAAETLHEVKSMGAVPFVNGGLVRPDFTRGLKSHHTSDLGLGSLATIYLPLWTAWLARRLARLAFKKGIVQ